MGVFYIFTVICLYITFILLKKSDKKINLICWLIISIIAYLGYNIAICMIFGVLNFTTNLIFLSIINIIFTILFLFIICKNKEIQKYEIRKRDILAIIICFLLALFRYIAIYKRNKFFYCLANFISTFL